MRDENRRSAVKNCRAIHFARGRKNCVERSKANQFKAEQPMSCVQQENAEAFLRLFEPRRIDDILPPEIYNLRRAFDFRVIYGTFPQPDNLKFTRHFELIRRGLGGIVATDSFCVFHNRTSWFGSFALAVVMHCQGFYFWRSCCSTHWSNRSVISPPGSCLPDSQSVTHCR